MLQLYLPCLPSLHGQGQFCLFFFKVWSSSSKILEFLSVLWLGKYAHSLWHRKQVHLRTSTKNSNEPWAIKTKNTGNKKKVAETDTTYFKQNTAPAHTANSFSEIKISHVIMVIKKEVHNCHRTYYDISKCVWISKGTSFNSWCEL